tara:strand:+ start:228 stop:371 length:144 start_codon:yes stop_codon:yes gene_type:complete
MVEMELLIRLPIEMVVAVVELLSVVQVTQIQVHLLMEILVVLELHHL